MPLKKVFADEIKQHRITTAVAIQSVAKALNDKGIHTPRGLSYTPDGVRNVFYGAYEDLQVEETFKAIIPEIINATKDKAAQHRAFMETRKQLTQAV